LHALLGGLGHETVALLTSRDGANRYGSRFDELVRHAPEGLDVLVPGTRQAMAPLLRAYEPDVLLCNGFPWKIPLEALQVPRLGSVNGHSSLLPRYRGPSPVAWAIRSGDSEIGWTFHRMDAEFDTGPILAQGTFPLEDEHTWDELTPKIVDIVTRLVTIALERVERGEEGEPQPAEGGQYASFFEPEYAWIDPTQTVAEVRRQVQAWRFASFHEGPRGALLELDGETVRVLRTSLEPGSGRELRCADGSIFVVETEPA
jgi:methionyl-tRNA formyltransferase